MKPSSRKRQPWLVSLFLTGFAPLFFASTSNAQAPELGLWVGASLEKRLSQSVALHLNGQLRYTDNLTVRRSALAELGVSYRFNKHWEVTGYYRYTSRRRYDDENYQYVYRPLHRFYADLSYDRKIWLLKLDYRLRYQNQFRDDADGQESSDRSYVRNKLELSYPNASRFTPYVSTDLFYKLGTGADQLRNKVGVTISVARHQKLDVFGFTDYQFIERQKNQLILGAMYRVKF